MISMLDKFYSLALRLTTRLVAWVIIGGLLIAGLILNDGLTHRKTVERLNEESLSGPWVSLQTLDPEIVSIARHEHYGNRAGPIDVLLERFLVPEDTRIELAIQGLRQEGLCRKTHSAEFLCMISGYRYKEVLEKLLQDGVVSSERYSKIRAEAVAFSRGKIYWNSPLMKTNDKATNSTRTYPGR